MARIVYFGKKNPIRFLNKPLFEAVVTQVCKKHGKTVQRLVFVLVSDEELLHINQEHLRHDYYTDIITFDMSAQENKIDAEIYISWERVNENSLLFDGPEQEMLRVLFHGVLHLCGYSDKSTAEQKEMRLKETHCVNLYRETKEA